MMQGVTATAMSVRAPDGKIVTEVKRRKPLGVWAKIPVIRGVIAFVMSLVTGVQCIMKSSRQAFPDEEQPSAAATVVSGVLGVVIAVALFMLLPGWIADILAQFVSINILVRSLIEGGIRIALFIVYLALVAKMKDIRRTFMYHGAEHRTINCYEHGMEVTVKNVQSCSTRHNRCGTTFLFFVMIMSILVFSLVTWIVQLIVGYVPDKWIMMCIRLLCLPLVAGLSYELLRFLAMLPDNAFVNILRAPGLALQRLTTKPPEDDMAEVAITAFNAAMNMDENPAYPEREFGEYVVKEVRDSLRERFKAAGVDEADADWIVCSCTSLKRSQLSELRIIEKQSYDSICECADKRLSGMPLDYVLGKSNFYGIELEVTPDVLIPRPETELLAERAIMFLKGDGGNSDSGSGKTQNAAEKRRKRALDLCCGSGCIAAAIKENTDAEVVAADKSRQAVAVAKRNLSFRGVKVVEADMFEALEGEKFDLIACNPPYIRSGDMAALQSEVRREPAEALDGGADGLDFYRILASQADGYLLPGGALMAETAFDEADDVVAMLAATGKYSSVNKYSDLEGHDRIVVAIKK